MNKLFCNKLPYQQKVSQEYFARQGLQNRFFFSGIVLNGVHSRWHHFKHLSHMILSQSSLTVHKQFKQIHFVFSFFSIIFNTSVQALFSKYRSTLLISMFSVSPVLSGIASAGTRSSSRISLNLCKAALAVNFFVSHSIIARSFSSGKSFENCKILSLVFAFFFGRPTTVTSAPFGLPRFFHFIWHFDVF